MRVPVKQLKLKVGYDPTRPLWGLHVPKCAGTTVRSIFEQWFPGQDPRIGLCTHFRDKENADIEDMKRKYGVPNPQLITVLREPFSWVQSLYWYQRWVLPDKSFLHDVNHELYSFQRYIHLRIHSPEEYLPRGDTAKAILSPCVIVGIYEELDAFMALVGNWIGQPLREPLPILHKTPEYEQQDLSEEYKKIRPDLYDLYDEAVHRWNEIS